MDLERIVKDFGKNLGKLVCDKKESNVKIDINRLDNIELFKILFLKLVHENKFNEAENLLFDEIKNNNREEVYQIGLQFYERLNTINKKILIENDFTENDILQGQVDLRKKCGVLIDS